MNNSSIEDTVSWLVNRLDRGGLLKKLALSDEDLADVLWLAGQMGVEEVRPTVSRPELTEPEPEPEIWQDDSQENTIVNSKPDEVIKVYPEPIIEPELTTSPETKILPFQAPAAPAIQNSLQISRAIRSLMKKFPSSHERILDEEATVTRIAERGVFVPVTKPKPERWLDLELIVEQSRSSFIWQETIDELRQILEIHGAFRSVRVWDLSSDDTTTELQLVRRKKGRRISKRQHSYRELIHSDRRGLVLLVSDCVSSIWQQGEIHRWLQQWSQKQPTAIVQLFPERMWDSTQLGVGRKLFSSALTPGVTNPKLILQNLPAWIPIDWQQALVLPVINLEPEILKQWSGVVAGSGKARISTYLFDLDFVAKQAKQKTTKSEVKTETSSQTTEDINSQKEREAEIIVKRFLATASITAQRLAGMMAAAPIDMRVVNLIRKTLLPEARPVHVAEVYMGGILESKVEGESRIYQFRDGVRRLLNKAMAQYEIGDVLDTISRYVAEELDRPIRSFTALLALLPTYSEAEKEQILPFAEVAVEVLENLGGEYAEFAAQVAPNLHPIPTVSTDEDEQNKYDFSNFPPLQDIDYESSTIVLLDGIELLTQQFEVAEIDIEEQTIFQTFEFVTAKLERRQKRAGLFKTGLFDRVNPFTRNEEITEWIIGKQTREAQCLIEELSSSVTLEMVLIPPGEFMMGAAPGEQDSRSNEKPQHKVTLQEAFLMGRYPVTREQWHAVVTLPQVNRKLRVAFSRLKGDKRPVEGISWEDAKEFCARLTQLTNREYRLPTEAEWEYACRAGTKTPFYYGETITTELANYNGNDVYGSGVKGEYREKTIEVGQFPGNEFGLCDLHGQVWEWCEDDWHENYEGAPKDGSAWLSEKSSKKVIRAGSWDNDPGFCRSAIRGYGNRDNRRYYIGFRVVCVAPRTT